MKLLRSNDKNLRTQRIMNGLVVLMSSNIIKKLLGEQVKREALFRIVEFDFQRRLEEMKQHEMNHIQIQ